MPESVFAKYQPQDYPFVFRGHVVVDLLAGGVPKNPDVAAGWIKSKGVLKDEEIRNEVARIIRETGVTMEEAVTLVAENRHLCGFKLDKTQGLYIEGRQMKACIKEAASIAADAGKIDLRGYGQNKYKQVKSFVAEHVFVLDERLYLGVEEPTDTLQSFISTYRGTGIQYTEVVENAEFDFRIETDKKFTEEFWGQLWLTAQRNGIGATRSQSYGQFTLVEWESIDVSQRRNGKVTGKVAVPA